MKLHWPAFLLFASDATLLALAGGVLLALAVFALIAERRRNRRNNIDAVGWMPWTLIFIISSISGIGLLTAALKAASIS